MTTHRPFYTIPNITESLRGSLERSGKSQARAAYLLGIATTHMSDIILMKRRMSPDFVEDWCCLVEPRKDNILRRHLHYLGAASDNWDLTDPSSANGAYLAEIMALYPPRGKRAERAEHEAEQEQP